MQTLEPEEMAEFSKEMREAGEQSLTHVSLIISVLAVLVAMVTVMGHREHTEAVLSQARASDRWNQYQARRIRQVDVGLAADALALQVGSTEATTSSKLTAKLEEYKERQAKSQGQLEEDSAEAHKLEAEIAVSERKATRFDLGEALLQIGVVLASVTLLTRHWRYVLVALALGISGIVAALSAFLVR